MWKSLVALIAMGKTAHAQWLWDSSGGCDDGDTVLDSDNYNAHTANGTLGTVTCIPAGAFVQYTGEIQLSRLSALTTINQLAFSLATNTSSTVDLSASALLVSIKVYAFQGFKGTITAERLYSLKSITAGAFQDAGNSESTVDLSTSHLLENVDTSAFGTESAETYTSLSENCGGLDYAICTGVCELNGNACTVAYANAPFHGNVTMNARYPWLTGVGPNAFDNLTFTANIAPICVSNVFNHNGNELMAGIEACDSCEFTTRCTDPDSAFKAVLPLILHTDACADTTSLPGWKRCAKYFAAYFVMNTYQRLPEYNVEFESTIDARTDVTAPLVAIFDDPTKSVSQAWAETGHLSSIAWFNSAMGSCECAIEYQVSCSDSVAWLADAEYAAQLGQFDNTWLLMEAAAGLLESNQSAYTAWRSSNDDCDMHASCPEFSDPSNFTAVMYDRLDTDCCSYGFVMAMTSGKVKSSMLHALLVDYYRILVVTRRVKDVGINECAGSPNCSLAECRAANPQFNVPSPAPPPAAGRYQRTRP